MRKTQAAAILLACAVAASGAARADWIVTKEGGKLETQGAWTVKGKLVVFTLPNGTLSSVRVDKVDLEASRAATEQAKRKAEEPPPDVKVEKPRRKSILSLTDKDFKKSPPPESDAGKDQKPAPGTETTPVNGIQVLSWNRVPPDQTKADGVQLTGKVRNGSSDLASDIVVTGNFYDDSGTLIAKVPAELSASTLPPGETATFTLTATGTYTFGSVKFTSASQGVKSKPSQPATAGREPAKGNGSGSSSASGSSQPTPPPH